MATKEELQPLIAPAGSNSSIPAAYSDPFGSDPSPSLTGTTVGIQQAHDSDHSRTQMVVSMDSVASSMRQSIRPVGAPEPRSRIPFSNGPDFLSVGPASSVPMSTNRVQSPAIVQELLGPSTPLLQEHAQCTEEDNADVAYQPSVTSAMAQGLLTNRMTETPSFLKRFSRGLASHPCIAAIVTLLAFVCVLVIVVSATVPSVLNTSCSVYNERTDVYSGDTALLQPDIDQFCHSSLFSSEVASHQGDYIKQEIDLYTGPCSEVKTYPDKISLEFNNFPNFTQSFPVMENEYLTVGSNLSFVINVSTANERRIVYVCLFNDIDYFKEFSSSSNWKDYIQYALKCTVSPITTSSYMLFNIFRLSITKADYYFVGFAVEGVLANLDLMRLHGVRYLYNTSGYKQINCTLTSEMDLPCQLPLVNNGEFPCLLAHAQTPQDIRRGYTGVELTSGVGYTTKRVISIAVPGVIGMAALVVLVGMLVICVVKLSRVTVVWG